VGREVAAGGFFVLGAAVRFVRVRLGISIMLTAWGAAVVIACVV
jgi:hypothetical protein